MIYFSFNKGNKHYSITSNDDGTGETECFDRDTGILTIDRTYTTYDSFGQKVKRRDYKEYNIKDEMEEL